MTFSPVAPAELVGALNWRYAVRRFDAAKKIPDDTWAALEQALVLAPSSFGIQPWKFVVVDDPAIRAQLVPASWGQTQPAEAAKFVVFAVRKDLDEAHIDRFVARTAEVRGLTIDSLAPFKKAMMSSVNRARAQGTLDHWQSHQIYIALGQFVASAAMLGVDTAPMEGLDPAKYDEILGLAGTGWFTLCACAAGYRSADDKYATTPKVRFQAADVIARV